MNLNRKMRLTRKERLRIQIENPRQRAYERNVEALRKYSPRANLSAEEIRRQFAEMEIEREQAAFNAILNDYTNF
jgi:hypothetical protein